jgi:hypothetical protein
LDRKRKLCAAAQRHVSDAEFERQDLSRNAADRYADHGAVGPDAEDLMHAQVREGFLVNAAHECALVKDV